MRRLTSISSRVMMAMVVAGVSTAGIAIFFASRAVVASDEAKLVDAAVERTERTRDAITGRLAQADSELRAAAWAYRAGRAFDVPSALSPFVLAVRVRGTDGSLDVARTPESGTELAAAADDADTSSRRLLGPGTVLVSLDGHDVRIDALVEVGSLLHAPPGGSAWLEAGTHDARLRRARGSVIADRTRTQALGEVVDAAASVDGGLVAHVRSPLAPARAEVAATVRETVAWSLVALVFLVLIAWVLARGVTRPVLALAASVRDLETGASARFPKLPDDEIGELGSAIRKMRGALERDAELLAATAAFARGVAQLRDAQSVLGALEHALVRSHPAQQWRVLPMEKVDDGATLTELGVPTSAAERAFVLAETSAPHRRDSITGPFGLSRHEDPRADGLLLAGLVVDTTRFGMAVGSGSMLEAEQRHVEVLCRTAVSALRSLALAESSVANEKLAVLGRLSASVAHEMNNPLSYLLMNLQMLEQDVVGAEQQAMLTDARAGAERLAAIVQDLSSISRASSSPARPEGLDAIVAAQLRVAQARGSRAAIEVEGEVGVWASCTRGRVEQALLNLLVNAVDAVADRGEPRIVVRIAQRGTQAVLTVADNGAGIPPAIRHRLFDAFVSTKGDRGTGLGLFLSRSLMQAQGGDLALESTGPSGTTFSLTLPLAEPPDEDPISQLPPSARRPAVLVIDDEIAIVRAMERLLGRRAEVVGTTSPADGLQLATARDFSLVLCDVHMPDMTGFEVVAELKRRRARSGARVVLMTGSADPPPPGVRLVRKPLHASLLAELLDAS